jgi:small subunit ribosomal protein S3
MERILQRKEIEGVKIKVKGRLNGTEIARSETFKKGKLPLQTIRANIDYGTARAHCTYGVVGIKVWLYKGEKI